MKLTRLLATASFVGLTGLTCLASVAHAVALPGPVVSAEWLANNLKDVQVIEVTSDVAAFVRKPTVETDKKSQKPVVLETGGHIDGALLFDFNKARTEKLMADKKVKFLIPEKADFEKVVRAVGINTGKPIVLVPIGQDIADIDEALRLLWQFKVFGEDNIAVLDGGMAGWLANGRPYSVAKSDVATGNWAATAYRRELVASSDQVAEASKTGKSALIDSRAPSQYFGVSKRDYVAGYGHIAGAKDFAPELLTRSAGGALYFLNKKTYEDLLTASGINPTAPAISYCNSGHLAAGSWFVANQILGNKAVSLYDGSLHLWSMEGRPLEGVALK